MAIGSKQSARPFFLGIEGGGTRTVALMADAGGRLLHRFEAGPGNLRLLNDVELARLFRSIAAALPKPDAIGVGLAGARTESDRKRIRAAAEKVWRAVPCLATNDLETALAGASARAQEGQNATDEAWSPSFSRSPARAKGGRSATVLVLSGTGSCCYGRNAAGKTAKVGGWGHVLGDRGSGYEIGLRALKAVALEQDRRGAWPKLGARILARLQLNEPEELIAWAQNAGKAEIAGLAAEVFAAWKGGDRIASEIIAGAKNSLVGDALACAQQLAKPKTGAHFILAGGVLLKQPEFAKAVRESLRKMWRGAVVSSLEREGAWGGIVLARSVSTRAPRRGASARAPSEQSPDPARVSPTEQRNPRSMNLDKLPLGAAIELMLSEDAKIPKAILAERGKIERVVRMIAQAFRCGGRLFYVGAGTSGRLGVLDASECPPTFRTEPEMVQGIIAGGAEALWRAVEGAEDDPAAGARAIQFRGVGRRDVVVGIAASGRTPFVWGALAEAKRRGAKTVLLSFNPFLKIPRNTRPDAIIAPNVGPEILTGSTRLKAGTTTKLILNIFTTLAMARIGKVMGNLMVDLKPSNSKLRDRAVRIVRELKGVDETAARAALEKSDWVIRKACARLRTS
jgi:N-acetylmuramic acid 6-phosphate etherase